MHGVFALITSKDYAIFPEAKNKLIILYGAGHLSRSGQVRAKSCAVTAMLSALNIVTTVR